MPLPYLGQHLTVDMRQANAAETNFDKNVSNTGNANPSRSTPTATRKDKAGTSRLVSQLINTGLSPTVKSGATIHALQDVLRDNGLDFPSNQNLSPAEAAKILDAIRILKLDAQENDVWSALHTTLKTGDKEAFDAMLYLIDKAVLDANQVGVDGGMMHQIVWDGHERTAPENDSSLMPGAPGFKPMPKGYITVADRIAGLSQRGCELDTSLYQIILELGRASSDDSDDAMSIRPQLDTLYSQKFRHMAALEKRGISSLDESDKDYLIEQNIMLHGSPLMCAIHLARNTPAQLATVTALLDHGAAPTRYCSDVQRFMALDLPATPLHAAALYGGPEVMAAFLRQVVDFSVLDANGQTVFHRAACNTVHPEVMEMLLQSEARSYLLQPMHGNVTPLHVALSIRGNDRIVFAILDALPAIAEINDAVRATKDFVEATAANGETALHYALKQDYGLPVIDRLLLLGGKKLIHAMANYVNANAHSNASISRGHGDNALHYALRFSSSPDIVRRLLEADVDINDIAADGSSALHYAAGSPHPGMINVLLEFKPSLHVLDSHGLRAIHVAAKNGNIPAFDKLLDAGDNQAPSKKSQQTMLHSVAESGNADAVRHVLRRGGNGDIHALNRYGETPLHRAAKTRGSSAVISVLFEAGALSDLNLPKRKGYTPLHLAVLAASADDGAEVVELFLAAGADTHLKAEDGTGVLHSAASTGNIQIMTALLTANQGALVSQINDVDDEDETPLQLASYYGPACIPLLLQYGADPHVVNEEGATPLHQVVFYSDEPAHVVALLEKQAPVHARDDYGNTALHVVLKPRGPNTKQSNTAAILKALLDGGATEDVNLPNHDGLVPLFIVALGVPDSSHQGPTQAADANIIAQLLAAGADAHARYDGGTLLHALALSGHDVTDAVNILAAVGVDPDARNKHVHASMDGEPGYFYAFEDMTVLEIALRANNPSIAQALIGAGANVNLRSKSGQTALLQIQRQANINPAWRAVLAGIDEKAGAIT